MQILVVIGTVGASPHIKSTFFHGKMGLPRLALVKAIRLLYRKCFRFFQLGVLPEKGGVGGIPISVQHGVELIDFHSQQHNITVCGGEKKDDNIMRSCFKGAL